MYNLNLRVLLDLCSVLKYVGSLDNKICGYSKGFM